MAMMAGPAYCISNLRMLSVPNVVGADFCDMFVSFIYLKT